MISEYEYDMRCIIEGYHIIKDIDCVLFDVGTNIGNFINQFNSAFSNKNISINKKPDGYSSGFFYAVLLAERPQTD